ncbi:vesicle-associated membrane protein 7-like [Rhopilema esculentum]|uniref:vesicle-associated membrane protein 7-like n=1 Tax=Rhopilema esculentum TaxID=499914 RepID=UPI0031D04C00|eukprot:gene587-10278_t
MSLLYSVIARGTTVLAKYAACSGNFQEITEHILSKIGTEDSKMTYTHANYLFHYIIEKQITYLCITDDDFERSKAFSFLSEVKKRFLRTYQARAQTALPYAMQSEFSRVLASQMRHYSDPMTSRETSSMTRVEEELDELKGIMVKNIDSIVQRGERLELLVEKTEDLNATSLTFKKSSRGLARAMCIKNIKLIILISIIGIVVIYFIVSFACGFDWKCGK